MKIDFREKYTKPIANQHHLCYNKRVYPAERRSWESRKQDSYQQKGSFFTMDASTFPISFTYHLIFCLIAGAFYVVQFIRLRRPYQLLLAVGIVASLLIYVGGEHNKVWFHTVGIFELVLLLGAIVLSIIARKKEKQAAAAQAADTAGDSKTEETDA